MSFIILMSVKTSLLMIKMINILVEHQSWSLDGLAFKVDHVLKTNAWIVANPIYGTLFEFPGGNAEHDDHDDNHQIMKVQDHDNHVMNIMTFRRLQVSTEAMQNMKTLKLNCWEEIFLAR